MIRGKTAIETQSFRSEGRPFGIANRKSQIPDMKSEICNSERQRGYGFHLIDRVRERGQSCPRLLDGRLENRPSYSKIILLNVTAEPVSGVNA